MKHVSRIGGGGGFLLRVAPHEQTTERKCLQHVWRENIVCRIFVRIGGCLVC